MFTWKKNKKSKYLKNLLCRSKDDQIDILFVSSDIKNDNNKSLQTLDVIDNAYRHVKYKKIKDILLPEIKNDISDFIQSEVKEDIHFHSQEEYQTVVDKKLITNLKKEIEFLKSEITTKNEIIKKLLVMISVRKKSCKMVRGDMGLLWYLRNNW